MLKRYTFWLWIAAILQLLTAAIHSLTFFYHPEPKNDQEKQLFDLITNYKFDLGGGFIHSYDDLVTCFSACFSLFYLFGGLMNIYLLRKKTLQDIMKGATGINVLIFGAAFLIALLFTFPPPIIMTGSVFLALCLAYATNHIHFIVLKED